MVNTLLGLLLSRNPRRDFSLNFIKTGVFSVSSFPFINFRSGEKGKSRQRTMSPEAWVRSPIEVRYTLLGTPEKRRVNRSTDWGIVSEGVFCWHRTNFTQKGTLETDNSRANFVLPTTLYIYSKEENPFDLRTGVRCGP